MQPDIVFTTIKKDGDPMHYGETAFEVKARRAYHFTMRKAGFKLYATHERHCNINQSIHAKVTTV